MIDIRSDLKSACLLPFENVLKENSGFEKNSPHSTDNKFNTLDAPLITIE